MRDFVHGLGAASRAAVVYGCVMVSMGRRMRLTKSQYKVAAASNASME